MKMPVKKKLKKHDRERWRYILVLKDDGERVKKILKINNINYKVIELVVRSLLERQLGRVILRVKRDDIENVKSKLKDEKIMIVNISGTLKGLLG